MGDGQLLTRLQVATKLGRTLNWLNRHIRKLQSERGFPQAIPMIGRWDGLAIDAWIARQNAASEPQTVDLDSAHLLDLRAAQLAQGLPGR